MTISSRLEKLRRKLVEKELDAILISQAENRRYLSGFTGSAGVLLITQDKAIIATDSRYTEQAERQAEGYQVFRIFSDLPAAMPDLLTGMAVTRLGFEADNVSFTIHRKLKDALGKLNPPPALVPTEGLVETIRAVKEPGEIELIVKAVGIVDRAYERVNEVVHVGMTEAELAWEIERFMRGNGSEALPFEPIVGSGPNGALAHATPGPRPIAAGEPIVIDIGATMDGYASDQTRTICIGQPTDTFKKIYDVVLGAQLTAIATIKEGMSGEEADKMARTVIEQAGYGEAFGHGLGHGVGLAIHEFPRLGKNSTDILTPGMAFTVEPGIYVTGWGGVRIEDIVVMEKGKVRVIPKTPKA